MVNEFYLIAEPSRSAMVSTEVLLKLGIAFIIAMSTVTFFIYGLDKRLAQKEAYRISEKALLWLCVLFGAIGGFFGMLAFRHKTRKVKFRLTVPVLALLQAAAAVWLFLQL